MRKYLLVIIALVLITILVSACAEDPTKAGKETIAAHLLKKYGEPDKSVIEEISYGQAVVFVRNLQNEDVAHAILDPYLVDAEGKYEWAKVYKTIYRSKKGTGVDGIYVVLKKRGQEPEISPETKN